MGHTDTIVLVAQFAARTVAFAIASSDMASPSGTKLRHSRPEGLMAPAGSRHG